MIFWHLKASAKLLSDKTNYLNPTKQIYSYSSLLLYHIFNSNLKSSNIKIDLTFNLKLSYYFSTRIHVHTYRGIIELMQIDIIMIKNFLQKIKR